MTTETTFRNMTAEHLGQDATEADLRAFVEACEMLDTDMSDEEKTAFVWNNGSWTDMVAYRCTNCGNLTTAAQACEACNRIACERCVETEYWSTVSGLCAEHGPNA